MADAIQADADVPVAVRRKQRRRRRRLVAGGAALAVVAAGAGTAWATRGSDGPSYRWVSATRADVSQTVDADGTLAARKVAALAFAAAGTVTSVPAAVGDTVQAGDVLATIDPSELKSAVDAAETTLAQAQQRLSDDEDAQASGTTTTAALVTAAATTIRLVAAYTADTTGGSSDSVAKVRAAQSAVVMAQHALDAAVGTQDGTVATLVSDCAASDDTTPVTASTTAGADGTVTGTAGSSAAIVSLLDDSGALVQTGSANPQRLAAGASYSFAGLIAGTTYRVSVVRSAVLNTTECLAAVSAVSDAQALVDSALTALDRAITALGTAVEGLSSSGGGGTTTPPSGSTGGTSGGTGGTSGGTTGGSGGTGGTGSGATSGTGTAGTSGTAPTTGTSTGSTGASGSTGSSAQSTTITAEQIAADAKSIDAAKAQLVVARHAVGSAHLTSTISGTVAAVTVSKGAGVTANSSTSAVTVVGNGTLSVDLSISLADIDLVRTGQSAAVTVDGRTTPVPAKVSYVGLTNTSSSTGSSSTYTVTVALDHSYASLYDGMGASVSIDVGAAKDVLSVPISAVHTTGALHTVDVYANGAVMAKRVTLGIVGAERAQVRSGLSAGDRVVLADLDAAVPSTDSNQRTGSSSSLTGGLTGGNTGGPGGFTGGGGPPGAP